MSIEINQLFGKPQAHEQILHPATCKAVHLMNETDQIRIAHQLLDAIVKSGRKDIVFIESGSAPLAKICQELTKQAQLKLRWHRLKVSRTDDTDYWTDIKSPIENDFLIFDEYVDTGYTIKKSIKKLQDLDCKSNPKIICYCWLNDDPLLKHKLEYACYTGNDIDYWQDLGAYPFENRVDLIGYSFDSQQVNIGPIYNNTYIRNVTPRELELSKDFLQELSIGISREEHLENFKKHCEIEAVRDYLNPEHCMRSCFTVLEALSSEPTSKKNFFTDLDDMYGPMWSPYPDHYQLDFQKAKLALQQTLKNSPTIKKLLEKYQMIKSALLSSIATQLEKHRTNWFTNIKDKIWTT